jgi:hypothetical protein
MPQDWTGKKKYTVAVTDGLFMGKKEMSTDMVIKSDQWCGILNSVDSCKNVSHEDDINLYGSNSCG